MLIIILYSYLYYIFYVTKLYLFYTPARPAQTAPKGEKTIINHITPYPRSPIPQFYHIRLGYPPNREIVHVPG